MCSTITCISTGISYSLLSESQSQTLLIPVYYMSEKYMNSYDNTLYWDSQYLYIPVNIIICHIIQYCIILFLAFIMFHMLLLCSLCYPC